MFAASCGRDYQPVVVQAFINISVVLGLMPTKGIPLPYFLWSSSCSSRWLASVCSEHQQASD
jgi:cell division protein FtsW (lipid II flippase)